MNCSKFEVDCRSDGQMNTADMFMVGAWKKVLLPDNVTIALIPRLLSECKFTLRDQQYKAHMEPSNR